MPERPRDIDEVWRLFELSTDLLATFDAVGRFTGLNPAWEKILGWDRERLLGTSATDLIHPDDVERTFDLQARVNGEAEIVQFENRMRCSDGSFRWLQWNARNVDDGWYAVGRDVSERKQLESQALVDPLTGLPNRVAFVDRLAQALGRLQRREGTVAVLFVDLDHFKVINDGRGHEVGDRFLKLAAGRLRDSIRGVDTVARLGGDEFVVLVEGGPDTRDVADVGKRVVRSLERPIAIDEEELWIGASVGIAMTSQADTAPDAMLREADVAMYRAKARGGGRWEIFDNSMRAEVEERVRVERDLRRALESDELCLYYQPIVALPELSVTRCEALVRWRHPARGLVLPGDFIPLAEETGLIVELGAQVLRAACEQAREWRRVGHDIGITVNVSTRQLVQPTFVDLVRGVLEDTDVPPTVLCLEITETAIMQRPERVIPGLISLRRLGVRIAMDDFGSGYSSLTYLKLLPLDIIKIDKSFVSGIIESPEDRAIVAAILRLAAETELSVIAEGVETEALHGELVSLGCDLAQGFLYDVPKPPDELELDGYSSRVRPGVGDPLVIREFMRQIGIPARIGS